MFSHANDVEHEAALMSARADCIVGATDIRIHTFLAAPGMLFKALSPMPCSCRQRHVPLQGAAPPPRP